MTVSPTSSLRSGSCILRKVVKERESESWEGRKREVKEELQAIPGRNYAD